MKKSKWFAVGIVALISAPVFADEGRIIPEPALDPIPVESNGVSIVVERSDGEVKHLSSRPDENAKGLFRTFLKDTPGCFVQGLDFASAQINNAAHARHVIRLSSPDRKARLVKLWSSFSGIRTQTGSETLTYQMTSLWEIPAHEQRPYEWKEVCDALKSKDLEMSCHLSSDKKIRVAVTNHKEVLPPDSTLLRTGLEKKCSPTLRNYSSLNGLELDETLVALGVLFERTFHDVSARLERAAKERLEAEAKEKARIESEKKVKGEADKKVDQLLEEIGTRDSKASSEAAI